MTSSLCATPARSSCAHCRSIVVRHDVDLERVSEWHLLFADGRTGWLSNAQLRYAVYERVQHAVALPPPGEVAIGASVGWGQRRFEVATITAARYRGTEGELPFESWDRTVERFVDLRGEGTAVATIDYSDDEPVLYVGRAASFEELDLHRLRDVDRARAVPVNALKCGHCGAPLVVKAPGQSQSVVCGHCGSIADASDPDVRVLQTVAKRARIRPKIPLGTSGDWHGARYEVIGFQRRTITVDGVDYSWDEYVLFDAQHGFRYLSEYDGHWNHIAVLDESPLGAGLEPTAGRQLRGRHYRHFQSAEARTTFVLGECPWVVTVGEKVQVHDCVSRLDIMRLGHGMIRPTPGFLTSAGRRQLMSGSEVCSSRTPTSAGCRCSRRRTTVACAPPMMPS